MVNSILTTERIKVNYNAKDIARGIIDELPDDSTLEEIMLELYVRVSILESRQQIASGQGLSLQQARKELDSWFTSQSLQNSSSN